jgi:hypothetical protein
LDKEDELIRKLFMFVMLVAAVGCSARGGGQATTTSQNELTSDQIRASGGVDAWEVIQRTRPLWLRTRSASSVNAPNTVLVYQNDTRLGGIDALRGYPLDAIVKITYLSASEAANKLPGTGSTVVDGAIVIHTRR